MAYIITSLCTNDGACVEVCPVACIHTTPGALQFYIDPEVCIDCEQCEIVCPVDAIFKDVDIPPEHQGAIEVNAAFFRKNKAAVQPVSINKAWELVDAAHAYAGRVGIKVSVAVVDEGGALIAAGRMDGAESRTADLAFYKAYTAATFHIATAELTPEARQPWMRSLMISHRGRILPAGGGVAIIDGVVIIGGIGVAGGRKADEDILCCQAALSVFEHADH